MGLHHGRQQPPAEEKPKRSTKSGTGRGKSRGGCLPRAKVPTPGFKSIFLLEVLDRRNADSLLCHVAFCIGCFLKSLHCRIFIILKKFIKTKVKCFTFGWFDRNQKVFVV